MRQDLDRLMQERGLAGMVVLAADHYSPAMHYATGQKIHYGIYFRATNGHAHLIHDPMERDQAAAVGCEISGFTQHGLVGLTSEEGSRERAWGRLIGQTCGTLGMSGRVAFYGEAGLAAAWQVLERAREVNPALQVDVSQPDVLSLARATKDEAELEAIRRASRATVAAMAAARGFLASLSRDGEALRIPGGHAARLGDVRRVVHRTFAEHGVVEDGDSIVSQGRDAGVPHNRGNDDEPVRMGATIIVDLFPGEAGGGYHSDMTRTFCVGRAPEAVKRMYADVHDAFQAGMAAVRVGQPCRSFQERVCELFESRGHATRRTNDAVTEGYVHNLGHGVGLAVHEPPLLGGAPSNTQLLDAGMVVSVEPGLYYPSQGMGARIEDLVVARPGGGVENLTPFPYDLEIETRG